METKTKKDKSTKKRKVVKSSEAPATTEAAAITPPLPTAESHSKTGSEKKRKILDSPEVVTLSEYASERLPLKRRRVAVEEIEVDISKPEPPSKRALRRLKKGKPLPPPKNGADTSPEPEEEALKKPEVEKRSEHGIWIGNLPFGVTKADLRAFLVSNSDIADDTITRIHMPSRDDGKPGSKLEQLKPWKKQHNKGFAYVDFAVAEAVQQSVDLSEQLLSGRRVLIKDNKSYEGRPQKAKDETKSDGKPPSKRVFLGNLRFDTTEDSLKEHFGRCGTIDDIMVATFEDSGKCKGYAWITFEDLEAAKNAVRGYVFVQQDEAAEFDPEDADQISSSDEKGDEKKKERPNSSIKTASEKSVVKKYWIDHIQRRPIRREFAEDAQLRYKKRYGKDGVKGKLGLSTAAEVGGVEEHATKAGNEDKKRAEKVRPLKQVEYRTPYAPRLTGGIVESKGKKLVF